MDDIQEILNRKEKRDAELDKIITNDGKENTMDSNGDDDLHRAIVRHSFKKAPKALPTDGTPKVPAVSTPGSASSIKTLRSRWELSSVTGTPLHPDTNNEEIIQAAVKLSQQRNAKGSVSSVVAPMPNSPTNTDSPNSAVSSPTCPPPPSMIIDVSASTTIKNDDVFKPITPVAPKALPPLTITDVPASSNTKNDSVFRPVTPTDQIIGSLWDDINSEVEKYKQSKQYQSDPNISPRSHFGSYSLQEGHTISAYRSQSAKRMGQSETDNEVGTFSSSHDPMLPEKRQRAELSLERGIVRKHLEIKNDVTDGENQHSAQNTTADQEAVLKRLHDAIIVQQDQICQASRALAFCRQNERFRGSREEIDAQRALLISTERRRTLLLERDHVINGRYTATENDLKGTLTFSAIAFKLSREYINNYMQHSSNTSLYYFIVLIKCGEHVFHTTLASSEQGIKSGFIEFSHFITVSGLSPDFTCEIEVYSLKAGHDSAGADRSVRSKKGTWRRMVISTPLNAYTNSLSAYSSSSAHRPIGVMDPGFQRIGHLTITRQLVHRQKFLLTDLTYPLEGTVVLNLDCHPDTNSVPLREYRSFLSLYEVISGLSSWTRFWCSLTEGQLRFWRYPEDEATKSPCVHLDLHRCVSPVVAVSSSAASFPNSMQVEVLLVDEKTNQKEGVSVVLFAADTPEEGEHWMDCINQTIRRSNVWRTVKRK